MNRSYILIWRSLARGIANKRLRLTLSRDITWEYLEKELVLQQEQLEIQNEEDILNEV